MKWIYLSLKFGGCEFKNKNDFNLVTTRDIFASFAQTEIYLNEFVCFEFRQMFEKLLR